jgi:hypothetical protein
MRQRAIVCLLFLSSCCVPVSAEEPQPVPEDVTFCQIAKNPTAYSGKRIRIRAVYSYKFTIITPSVGERVVRRRLVSVEPEPRAFSQKMRTDERLLTFTVSPALYLVRHPTTNPRGRMKLCQRLGGLSFIVVFADKLP